MDKTTSAQAQIHEHFERWMNELSNIIRLVILMHVVTMINPPLFARYTPDIPGARGFWTTSTAPFTGALEYTLKESEHQMTLHEQPTKDDYERATGTEPTTEPRKQLQGPSAFTSLAIALILVIPLVIVAAVMYFGR